MRAIPMSYHAEDPDKKFGSFLELCINRVGASEQSAMGQFRHADLIIEVPGP
jgi:hypothetical protein